MFCDEEKLYDLEPTMDFVFKRIFGYDDTKDSLICLPSSMDYATLRNKGFDDKIIANCLNTSIDELKQLLNN